ncbi:bifunctional oligoribonuclease/PAP phosphatase NrnA [bacterium]|nr:bifunctional oligoribonuclease/PAP phosphatase NrnA [bacterium]
MKPEMIRTQAEKFLESVKQQQRILVTTHVSPDGDAIASLLAAAKMIHLMGSQAICFLDGGIPSHIVFLPGSGEIITSFDNAPENFDAVLAVDAATLERIGDTAKLIQPGQPIINIDHHADNPEYGHLNIIFPEAASTTEILFQIAVTLNLPIDKDLATLLYTGLVTDTGGFRYSNTSARAFQAACDLTQRGANPNQIAEAVFASNTESSIRMLTNALSNLDICHHGQIATMSVDTVEGREEPEDLAEYPLRVRGVVACALFRKKDGKTRVSLRSRGAVSVSDIAHTFGGGGHPNAAGFTVAEEIDTVRPRVIEALRQEVEKSTF